MKFVTHSGTITSINDKQLHRVNAQETAICFKDALNKVKTDMIIYSDLPYDDDYIELFPRDDGNYSMVDELFQFIPNEKWASVAISFHYVLTTSKNLFISKIKICVIRLSCDVKVLLLVYKEIIIC